MSDIRYDRIHDTHVVISPERLHRPDCFRREGNDVITQDHCPFCEGNESMTPAEIFAIRKKGTKVNEKGWLTRVVPNLYKALQIEANHAHHFGIFEHWEGFGAHEVIIDTPQHHTSMVQWSEEMLANWLKTLRARVLDLQRDHRIAYISLFKNEGRESGATQEHSHTQLIGLPLIPKLVQERFRRNYIHYQQHAKALIESEIMHEEQCGERIIATNGELTAYCPYASAYPFEVIISSKKAIGQIDTLHDDIIEEMAPFILKILKSLHKQLGCISLNISINTPPLQRESFEYDILSSRDDICRFELRLMPRLYQLAGFEVSSGMMINPVIPEHAAKLLRESYHD